MNCQEMPSATGQEAVYQKFLTKAGVNTVQEARNLSAAQLKLVNYQIVSESYPYGTFTFGEYATAQMTSFADN